MLEHRGCCNGSTTETTRLHWHGQLAESLAAAGDDKAAKRELDQQIAIAEEVGDDDVRARGLLNLLTIQHHQGDLDTTATERAADAAVARLGSPAISAELHLREAISREARGDLPAALALMRQAQQELESVAIEAHGEQLVVMANLGAIQQSSGELRAAQVTLDRAYEIARRRFGDASMRTFMIRGVRATNYLYAGDVAKALPELTMVADALAKALGPDHRMVV
jgi:hypothetical protein